MNTRKPPRQTRDGLVHIVVPGLLRGELILTLILLLVEEEILLGRIVRPNVLDALIRFTVIIEIVKVLNDFQRCALTRGVIDQLILRSRPRRVLKFRCKF